MKKENDYRKDESGSEWLRGHWQTGAEAVILQDDMDLAGVADITADWRIQVAGGKGMRIYAARPEASTAMTASGIEVVGSLDEFLAAADVVVDCTPKKVAAANIETYRRMTKKFILQGGEKHDATGLHFVLPGAVMGGLSKVP